MIDFVNLPLEVSASGTICHHGSKSNVLRELSLTIGLSVVATGPS